MATLNKSISQFVNCFCSVAGLLANSAALSPVAGECHRLGELLEWLERVEEEEAVAAWRAQTQAISDKSAANPGAVLALRNVTINAPGSASKCLVSHLSFELQPGQSICVNGANGSGKSALLRAVAGLWDQDGALYVPPGRNAGGLFCVPQVAYAVFGSLLEQVVYPLMLEAGHANANKKAGHSLVLTRELEEQVYACLQAVRLPHIAQRFGLHSVQSWDAVLSGGEKQRLGVARVLFHRPCVGVLDECTSALDENIEAACLSALIATRASFVFIGNRPALLEHVQASVALTVRPARICVFSTMDMDGCLDGCR